VVNPGDDPPTMTVHPSSPVRIAALLLLIVSVGSLAAGQEQVSVYTSSVGLTRVKVAVVGDDGIPVKGLGVEDFSVRERGVDREVQVVLSPEDNALDVVLALDFSQSIADNWPDARDSAHDFLDSLSINDCVYLLPFNTRVGPGVWGGPDNPDLRRTVDVFPIGGATRLYDSLLRAYQVLESREMSLSADPLFHRDDELDPWPAVGACSRQAAERSGERRRAIVLLTDGADYGSNVSYGDILVTSWHAEVPIFSVAVGMAGISGARYRTQQMSRGWGRLSTARRASEIDDLRDQLAELARVTGGQFVSQREIRRGYDDVLGLLRGYYVIGYEDIDADEDNEGWSEVEVEVVDDDLDVIVQPGVYRMSRSVQPALVALRRGRALFRRGDYEAALAEFDLATALAPAVGSPFYGRGLVLEALERWEAARDSYLRALYWDPGSPAAQGRLADVSLHLGEYDAAWEYAVRARLGGVDVRGVMELLRQQSEPPFDVAERLAVPVVGVMSPHVASLTALLDLRETMRTIINRIDASPEFGYTTLARFADVLLRTRVDEYGRSENGVLRLEAEMEVFAFETEDRHDERLRIENLEDDGDAHAAIVTTLGELLDWVRENVEAPEREIDFSSESTGR
jgi:VWFA-related protein